MFPLCILSVKLSKNALLIIPPRYIDLLHLDYKYESIFSMNLQFLFHSKFFYLCFRGPSARINTFFSIWIEMKRMHKTTEYSNVEFISEVYNRDVSFCFIYCMWTIGKCSSLLFLSYIWLRCVLSEHGNIFMHKNVWIIWELLVSERPVSYDL